MSKWLNTVEAADLAGVSVSTIGRAVREGDLKSHGWRTMHLLDEADVLRFAAEHAARPESRRGHPRPPETNKRIGGYVPKHLADWLCSRAAEQGVSTYQVLRDILEREYEKEVR